jgi:uncharacterized membrane protein
MIARLRQVGLWGCITIAFGVLGIVRSDNWWARAVFSLLVALSIMGIVMLLSAKRAPRLPPEEVQRRAIVRQRSSRPYVLLALIAAALAVAYLPLAVHEGWGVRPLLGFYFGECLALGGAGVWIEARINRSTRRAE